jgi:hypothetical protein
MFEYVFQLLSTLKVGGRSLSGWINPHYGGLPPRYAFVVSQNSLKVNNFVDSLFQCSLDLTPCRDKRPPLSNLDTFARNITGCQC